jgi:hypothetical protein
MELLENLRSKFNNVECAGAQFLALHGS